MPPSRETSIVAAASGIVVVLAVLLRYESALLLGRFPARRTVPPRPRMLVPVFGLLTARMTEVGLFAFAAWVLLGVPGVGDLAGHGGAARQADVVCAFATTCTTPGRGDVVPVGDLRFLFGMEALAGPFLIPWSASLGFPEMRRHWRGDHAPDGAGAVPGYDEAATGRRAPAGAEGRRP